MPIENQLIASLPRTDRLRLLNRGESVGLILSDVLCEAGAPTSHVYFPVEGFVSLVLLQDGHPGLEVGMVGREGMVGAHTCLTRSPSALRALVQGRGQAHRVATDVFQAELNASSALRHAMHRYLQVMMEQLATSASCLRFHLIGPRLARWLLMSHDRARLDTFHVTQDFLGYMLGVRRVSVNEAARALQDAELISYARGVLTVRDRPGLEAAACSCYRINLQSYADVLPF